MNEILIEYPFADLELSRRLERAEGTVSSHYVLARAQLDPASGAAFLEVGGTKAMFDGVDSPITQTFCLGLFATPTTEDLNRIEGFFREHGAPVMHEVSPLVGAKFFAMLCDRGYKPIELSSVLYRPIWPDVSLGCNENVQLGVRPIREDEQEVWAQTAASGWSEHGDFFLLMRQAIRAGLHGGSGIAFLAELAGTPIAAAMLHVVDGVALLAGASTIPTHRKQGAQFALLEERLRYAADLGCGLAMMATEPGSASQRNAQRHGFRIAYTRVKWQLAERAG